MPNISIFISYSCCLQVRPIVRSCCCHRFTSVTPQNALKLGRASMVTFQFYQPHVFPKKVGQLHQLREVHFNHKRLVLPIGDGSCIEPTSKFRKWHALRISIKEGGLSNLRLNSLPLLQSLL